MIDFVRLIRLWWRDTFGPRIVLSRAPYKIEPSPEVDRLCDEVAPAHRRPDAVPLISNAYDDLGLKPPRTVPNPLSGSLTYPAVHGWGPARPVKTKAAPKRKKAPAKKKRRAKKKT
jgi:hypothetical protein